MCNNSPLFFIFGVYFDLPFTFEYYSLYKLILLWSKFMHRISITLEPAVFQLINKQPNRSAYISKLILSDAFEQRKDAVVERVKASLLEDDEWVAKFKLRAQAAPTSVKRDEVTYTNDWGA